MAAACLAFAAKLRRRNRERVRELEQETKERMHREQMNVFTNFSHELRTPLTLILDPLRNILLDESLTEGLRKSLTMIQANADRILTLVNQLMDFRRQDSGQMKLRSRRGDIVRFSEEMAAIFNEQARTKGIGITVHGGDAPVMADFDPFLMEKVFFNLLSNAVKNTPGGGSIDIVVSCFSGRLPETLKMYCPKSCSEEGTLFS